MKVGLLAAIFLFVSCSQKSISDNRFVLGTVCSVTINGTDDEELLSSSFDLLYEIDRRISRFDEDSWIYRINENAGRSAVSVPRDVYELIKASLEMAEKTDGVFNPAIGPLSALWGFGTDSARVPERAEIEAVLPLLDWHAITLSDDDLSVFLEKEGMALDLGAVGKGWACDELRDYLLERGVESALINLGGNIAVIGSNGGEPWRIGIQRPFADTGSYFTVVSVENASVVVSGGYQRYIEKDGVFYHHILSSETGYPAETDLTSAAVICQSSTLADMLSTTLFASGHDKALEIADEFGVRTILLTDDLEVTDFDGKDSQIAVLEE